MNVYILGVLQQGGEQDAHAQKGPPDYHDGYMGS